MKGRRLQPDEHGWFGDKLEPGDYVKVEPKAMADGSPLPDDWPWKMHYPYWIGCSPNGHSCALGAHKIEEHDDGTITVSPSILIHDGKGTQFWHGYLEHGVWRTV